MTTKELNEKYVLNSYAPNYTNFVRGEGATLYDENDKDYIDFVGGIAVVSVGHGNERISKIICNQVSKIIHISNLYSIEPQAKLAQKIVDTSGYDMKCFFGNSGSEANECAIKIARKYGEENPSKSGEKRYKVITLKNSFHGRSITTVKATGQEKMHNYFGPYPDGFVYSDSIEEIYSQIDDHTVAVMIELIQGEGGVSNMARESIKKLEHELKEKDILLIVDEVQTGIYRTGEFLASNLYDIKPDIITLAKGLATGVPISCTMTTLKDIFAPGDHGSTFGGNFLSTATASEVIDILQEYKDSGDLDKSIKYFDEKLNMISSKYGLETVGYGFMRGLRIGDDTKLKNIIDKACANGLLVVKAGMSTLRFLPPITISKEEIDLGFDRLNETLRDVEC